MAKEKDDQGRAKIMWSEIFYSFQGEGAYTGVPTAWLRLWKCNLQCNGFGQKEPTNAETWELPYSKIDITQIKTLSELPVFDHGCDSSYSWSKKFKHLINTNTVEEVVDRIYDTLPDKIFQHRKDIHLAFTGGEPMLWQESMIDVVTEMIDRGNYPSRITVETNGTKHLSQELSDFISMIEVEHGIEWFWSISPKLYNVSGEKNGINLEVISEYLYNCSYGQVKFVLNNSENAWKEVDAIVSQFDLYSIDERFPIYIMPAGSTKESQDGSINSDIPEIAKKALERGWSISSRVHCTVFGNGIGT